MCTHVVYSFVVLNTQKFNLKIFDQWLDIDLKNYEKFVAMKKKNPKLKVLVALGGWTGSSRLNSVEQFNPSNNTWTLALTTMQEAKHTYGAVPVTRAMICTT